MGRIIRTAAGFTLLLLGVAMLFLPGPGILTIMTGLGLLARDFEWARRLVRWGRSRLRSRSGSQAGG